MTNDTDTKATDGEQPSPGEDSAEHARALAQGLAGALNVAGLLAAPRVFEKVLCDNREKPTIESLSRVLDEAIGAFGSSASDVNVVSALSKLRDKLSTWALDAAPPQGIVDAARDVLKALDVPEPAQGWDRWEGPSGEEASPRPAPNLRLVPTAPVTSDKWLAYDGPGELVDGVLVAERIRTPEEDLCAEWSLAKLRAWALPRGARVYGRGHKLAVSRATGRKPAACVYTANNPDVPLLVLEIVPSNPADICRARMAARREYADLGISWYWIMSPSERLLEIYKLEAKGQYELFMSFGGDYKDGLEDLFNCEPLWAEMELGAPPSGS